MKLYVKCERCGGFAPMASGYHGQSGLAIDVPPKGWERIAGHDLCPACAGLVSLAIHRALEVKP